MRLHQKSWSAKALLVAIGIALLLLCYVASIGPVYYCWAAFSADMTTHAKIEAVYSPVLEHGSQWSRNALTAYRDVARIEGHRRLRDPVE